jgi:phage terminase large subunit-like protein
MSQLADGRADWLMGRRCHVEPAVYDLEYELDKAEDDSHYYRVTGGTPTWVGQGLAVCQRQINEWGLRSFLQEAQHEVKSAAGYFFDETKFGYADETELPEFLKLVRAWDYAATQAGGDYTVGVLMGLAKNGRLYILDVVRAQLSSDNVETLLSLVTEWDRSVWDKDRGVFGGGRYSVRVPQDPGSAGKRVAQQDKKRFGAKADPVTGSKASRAKNYAEKVNRGDVVLVRDGRSRTKEIDDFLERMTRNTALDGKSLLWHHAFKEEHRQFREDEKHAYDDQVDPSADAYNDLAGKRTNTVL